MIRYQNIYYMLAYAFRTLQAQGYEDVAKENFENTADLLSAILCHGVTQQVKSGLLRQYVEVKESTSIPKGKIDISQSIKTQSHLKKQLFCDYDEFSLNAYPNRILKTTLLVLLKSNISKQRIKKIKSLLVYFNNVDELCISNIHWKFQYNRNNQTYKMLINVCHMVIKGLLQTTSSGKTRLLTWLDDQHMHKLYEKFVLEYFKQHYSPKIKVKSSEIKWFLDVEDNRERLPLMQSDIMLTCGKKILIIDTKYYSHIMQSQYNKSTYRSANLYQIFTYVKNMEATLKDTGYIVSGMLLYAQTVEEENFSSTYIMSGNKISVKTLNLNSHFRNIKEQLDAIAEDLIKT